MKWLHGPCVSSYYWLINDHTFSQPPLWPARGPKRIRNSPWDWVPMVLGTRRLSTAPWPKAREAAGNNRVCFSSKAASGLWHMTGQPGSVRGSTVLPGQMRTGPLVARAFPRGGRLPGLCRSGHHGHARASPQPQQGPILRSRVSRGDLTFPMCVLEQCLNSSMKQR